MSTPTPIVRPLAPCDLLLADRCLDVTLVDMFSGGPNVVPTEDAYVFKPSI